MLSLCCSSGKESEDFNFFNKSVKKIEACNYNDALYITLRALNYFSVLSRTEQNTYLLKSFLYSGFYELVLEMAKSRYEEDHSTCLRMFEILIVNYKIVLKHKFRYVFYDMESILKYYKKVIPPLLMKSKDFKEIEDNKSPSFYKNPDNNYRKTYYLFKELKKIDMISSKNKPSFILEEMRGSIKKLLKEHSGEIKPNRKSQIVSSSLIIKTIYGKNHGFLLNSLQYLNNVASEINKIIREDMMSFESLNQLMFIFKSYIKRDLNYRTYKYYKIKEGNYSVFIPPEEIKKALKELFTLTNRKNSLVSAYTIYITLLDYIRPFNEFEEEIINLYVNIILLSRGFIPFITPEVHITNFNDFVTMAIT